MLCICVCTCSILFDPGHCRVIVQSGGLCCGFVTRRGFPRPRTRTKLLIEGITLRNNGVTCLDKNPFLVRGEGEGDMKTTKVIVGNVPLSFNNKDIEDTLVKLGCKLQSNMFMEKDRDDRGKLTRWLTGRRFVYIALPEKVLPQRVDIGIFKATIYHREQKLHRQQQQAVCGRCFLTGHDSRSCANDIVCRDCRQSGHKQGNPLCTAMADTESEVADDHRGEGGDAGRKDDEVSNASRSRDHSPASERFFDATLTPTTTETSTPVQRKSRATAQSTVPFKRSGSNRTAKELMSAKDSRH